MQNARSGNLSGTLVSSGQELSATHFGNSRCFLPLISEWSTFNYRTCWDYKCQSRNFRSAALFIWSGSRSPWGRSPCDHEALTFCLCGQSVSQSDNCVALLWAAIVLEPPPTLTARSTEFFCLILLLNLPCTHFLRAKVFGPWTNSTWQALIYGDEYTGSESGVSALSGYLGSMIQLCWLGNCMLLE